MAFNSTAGDPLANSYASVAEFTTYASIRLPHIEWIDTASTTSKENTLILARILLDSYFDWTGVRSTTTQALPIPRLGWQYEPGFPVASSIVPEQIKNAQSELALQLASGDLLASNDAFKKGIKRVKASSVEVEFQDLITSSQEELTAYVLRQDAGFNYLAAPDTVRLLLVSSWYKQKKAAVGRAMFKVA